MGKITDQMIRLREKYANIVRIAKKVEVLAEHIERDRQAVLALKDDYRAIQCDTADLDKVLQALTTMQGFFRRQSTMLDSKKEAVARRL